MPRAGRIVEAGIAVGGVLLLALMLLPAAAQWSPSGEPLPNPARRAVPLDQVSPKRDSLDQAFPRGKPRVSSPWLDGETRGFTALLKPGPYDVMVAPIRSEGYALDRISRALIHAELSRELAARKLRVPNPGKLANRDRTAHRRSRFRAIQ